MKPFISNAFKFSVTLIIALCLIYAIFFVIATKPFDTEALTSDEKFKHELIASIMSADKIVITEHSSLWDWSKEDYEATATKVMRKVGNSNTEIESLENKTLPVITYQEVELNIAKRLKLLVLLKLFSVGKSNNASLCIFSSHHSVQLYKANTPTKIMEVCFQCNQITWNDSVVSAPSLIYKILQYEVNSLGLSAKRDWSDYLNQWRKNHPIDIKKLKPQ